jgi:hypothetical protein
VGNAEYWTQPASAVEFLIPLTASARSTWNLRSRNYCATRARIGAIAADGGERTYDNTMQRLDEFTEPLDQAMGW